MSETVDAVYEGGVLRPVRPLRGVKEHAHVRVTVESQGSRNPLRDCIGIMPEEDASEILRIVNDEFGRVNPRDWS